MFLGKAATSLMWPPLLPSYIASMVSISNCAPNTCRTTTVVMVLGSAFYQAESSEATFKVCVMQYDCSCIAMANWASRSKPTYSCTTHNFLKVL